MCEIREERVHTEPVVLNIGGAIGALIIYTDADAVGREIELSPKGENAARFHNQVHARAINGSTLFAAVYPEIRAGEYNVWGDASTPAGSITIQGGQVATIDWRSARAG